MLSTQVASPLFFPLTSTSDLVESIQRISEEPRQQVIERLLAEHRCIGTNVRNETKERGLPPYVWTDNLIDFYRTTKSFLYESAVWNRSRLKVAIRSWIQDFLKRHNITTCNVLTYGDGLGFDSTFLASLGCDVTYFEPSEECVRFAREVFAANGVTVRHISDPALLVVESFDVIVCLDVLEHVPNPTEIVKLFSGWLKSGGFLITHSPFFFIDPFRPTHLKSNMRHSGDDRFFRDHGLHPFDGKLFWDPIVLCKSDCEHPRRRLTAVKLGKQLLRLGRWRPNIHSQVARLLCRTDRKWIEELTSLREETA